MAYAKLHSKDKDGMHTAPAEKVKIIRYNVNNDYIIETKDGIRCHAIYNPFVGYYFADDVYGIVEE